MIDIAIKGSCVSREAFNYQKELFNEEIFHVSNYIFQKPIAVIESEKIKDKQNIIDKLKIELINQESVQDFVVNQVSNSFSKEFFRDVKEKEKYFMIDFVDERMKLIRIEDSFIEYRREFINVLEKEKISFEIENNTKDIFFQYIDSFIKTIKNKYSEENIILHKAFAVNTTKIDNIVYPLTSTFANPLNNRSINSYSIKRSQSVNLFFLEVYEYIERTYPNIKIIELPLKKYYSPSNHKYGRGYYHYDDQYYFDFLNKLKELLVNNKATKHDDVARENQHYINDLQKMQTVIANIYDTNKIPNFAKNPEELLFRPLNSPINYRVNSGGKPLVKSYFLDASTPGIIIYNNQGEIKGKFILNNNNELERIYTYYKNKSVESITDIEHNGISSTKLFDEFKKNISKKSNIEKINRGIDNVYSFYNQNEKLILRIIDHTKLNRKRIIFYENNRISLVIIFENDKISKILKYNNIGRIFEEFIMGEYINIGKVHVKYRYNKNKKSVRYFFYASANIQARTFFTEDERYLKTEIFDDRGKIRKEILFNNKGKKMQTTDFQAEGRKKVSDYFDSGIRQSISFYKNEELIKKVVRTDEKELFRELTVDIVSV